MGLETTDEIGFSDGSVTMEAAGRWLRLPIERIADSSWMSASGSSTGSGL